MTRARVSALAAATLAAAVAVVLLGRWSAHRAEASQLSGIARIRHEVGPLDRRALDAYRLTPSFDCLLYRVGTRIAARELCFDATGGLIEAIDRTGPTPSFWSVRYEPALAQIHVAPTRILHLLRELGAGDYVVGADDRLPMGYPDVGPVLRVKAPPP